MRFFLPVLAAILLLPSLVLAAPKLWGDVEVGMSQGEIRGLYPSAIDAVKADGSRDTIGNQGNKAVEMLRIPGHTYRDAPFTVRFFFKDAGLHLVMLTHENPRSTSLESLPDWVAPFNAEYGDPVVRDSHPALDRPGIVYRQFIWLGNDKNVVVVWARAGEGAPIMNINFTAP